MIGDVFSAVPSRADRASCAHAYRGRSALALMVHDLAMFLVAVAAAEALEYRTVAPAALFEQFVVGPVVFVVIWMLLFARIGLYRISFAMTVRDEIYIVATALFVGIVPQLALLTVVPALSGSRLVLVLSALLATVFVGGGRALLHAGRNRAIARRPRRVAIAAGSADAAPIAAALELPPGSAIFAGPNAIAAVAEVDALVERCAALRCAALYLDAIPPPALITRLIVRAREARMDVAIAPPALRDGGFRFAVERAGMQTVLRPRPLRVRTPYAVLVKRSADVVVASLVLVLAAPVMLLAALSIVVDTGYPVFYRQRRIGMDGTPFAMFKFRSMVAHGAGNAWATRSDPRVTRVGAVLRRYSIDELPQMINVLRGEMSVVGPRPEIPEYVERFEREVARYADRHLVKPGITGWSQLYLDRLLTPDDVRDVLRLDLFYIEHWGIFMDLSIVAKTAAEFLFHRAP
ncbi:MAG: undecaprenyl-phosphate glucose phosphotransferase [Candidatus Elarobacter sp.]